MTKQVKAKRWSHVIEAYILTYKTKLKLNKKRQREKTHVPVTISDSNQFRKFFKIDPHTHKHELFPLHHRSEKKVKHTTQKLL